MTDTSSPISLYTPATEANIRLFPIARPWADFILFSEYGHKYIIEERGDLAILYFTTTPLVSAHLFRRSPAGWQLDLAAEIRDTREFVNSEYTWSMMSLSGDDYSLAFADLHADFGPSGFTGAETGRAMPTRFLRPARGDNRPLPRRTGCDVQRLASAWREGSSHSLGKRCSYLETRRKPSIWATPSRPSIASQCGDSLLSRSYDSPIPFSPPTPTARRATTGSSTACSTPYATFDVPDSSFEPLLTEWVERRPASAPALPWLGPAFLQHPAGTRAAPTMDPVPASAGDGGALPALGGRHSPGAPPRAQFALRVPAADEDGPFAGRY